LLEQIVLLDSVREDYHRRAQVFQDWMAERGLAPETVRELLAHLLEFLDHLFLDGAAGHDGSKIVAAVRHLVREVESDTVMMHRVSKALQGWNKRCPGGMRDPPPWEGVLAVVGWLLHRNEPVAALACLVQGLCYLRPGELTSLRTAELLAPPAGAAAGSPWCLLLHSVAHNPSGSKTNERDESLLLNSAGYEWMNRELRILKELRSGAEMLWPFDASRYAALIGQAASATNQPDFVPYSLRHAGASRDLLLQARSTEEVKMRGRWRSDSSLRRYGKPAKQLQGLARLSPSMVAYGQAIEQALPLIFRGMQPVPPPPQAAQP